MIICDYCGYFMILRNFIFILRKICGPESAVIHATKVDNRLQTFDRITSLSQRTNAFKLCKNEMLNVCEAKETLLSKECENEMYARRNMFLSYMQAKCVSEMKKYVKSKVKKKLNKYASCFATYK